MTKPADPTRSGYTFKGWYKDVTLAQPYDFNTNITSDFKLYAKWEKVTLITTAPTNKPTAFSVSKASFLANSLTLTKGLNTTFKDGKLTFHWKPVSGATGYKIYAAKCGKKLKLIKTIQNQKANKTSITKLYGKKLSNSASYKVYVVAYKTVSKKNYNLGKSLLTHCAGTTNKQFTNVASLQAKKASISLQVKETAIMKVSKKKQDKSKKYLPKDHCARLRYISSNTSIASVSSTGKITAKKKGKCTIYAVAINGKSTKMTITVKIENIVTIFEG